MPKKEKVESTVIDREPGRGKRGARPYSREQVYRWLYTNSDSRGIVIFSQREVAKKLEIGYQNVCNMYSDFIRTGYINKHSRTDFEIIYDPDDLEWDDEVLEELSRARKIHQFEYRQKEKLNE